MTCNWDISYARCESSNDKAFLKTVEPSVKNTAEEMATELLNNWTGKSFGVCPFVVRPVKDSDTTCEPYSPGAAEFTQHILSGSSSPWKPELIRGKWYNLTCRACYSSKATERDWQAVTLPSNLHEVTAVWLNGKKLEPGQYAVLNGVVYPGDGIVFPEHQDLTADFKSEANTFAIEFTAGTVPPTAGKVAAGVLAVEIMRSLCKDRNCQLPERLQSITRQGVTMGFIDSFEGLDEGKTGLWLVDSWVASLRGSKRSSAVYSPDGARTTRKRYKF